MAAVTTPRPTKGSHQGTASPAYVGAAVVACIGRMPTRPSAPRPRAPTARPPPARVSGGTPLRVSADMTKYVAAPSIAASAHRTPSRARSAPDSRSSTSTSPTAATPAPASVSARGRSPRRSHSHTTMALPQLVRHDGLDWHIHAVPRDAPLDRRIVVESALAMVDVIRTDELSRLSV